MRPISFSSAGGLPRIAVRGLPLVLAAGLALTASACMAPSAKQGSAADRQAATVDPGSKSGAGGEKEKAEGKSRSWWQRMTQSGQEPKEKPWVYGDVRPGKGLLGNDEDGFVLLRKGEGQSSNPSKPQKVRR